MKDYEILFVDDDKVILDMVQRYLARQGYVADFVDSGTKALELLKDKNFDIIFTDFKMPEIDGMELLSAIKEYRPDTEVIIVTGHGTMETAIQAMKIGSYDYIQKPFKLDMLKLIIDRIIEDKKLRDENVLLKTRVKERHKYDELIGINLKMQEIYEIIDRMKNTSPNVLIQGESGTGKALAAKVIHRRSDRGEKPLVTVNCHSFFNDIPAKELKHQLTELLESAEGCTLYLDELTDIAPPVQDELLKLIQTNVKSDQKEPNAGNDRVRLITATNKDLKESFETDVLRKKFYSRVSTVSISMPPLRNRKEDICLLIHQFLFKYNVDNLKPIHCVSPEALDYLLRYHWPGNVIQLENVIERAFALGVEKTIEVEDLPSEIKTFGDIAKAET